MIAGKSELTKHTEFRSFATLNVACSSLSEAALAIGGLEKHSMPLTGTEHPGLAILPTMYAGNSRASESRKDPNDPFITLTPSSSIC